MIFDFYSLVKCDLWMNFIDPVEVLPNHPKMCSDLRIGLTVHERNCRLESSVSPSVASDESDDEDWRSGKIPFSLDIISFYSYGN